MTRNEMICKDIENGMPIEEVGYKYCLSITGVREAVKSGKITMKLKASIEGAEVFDKYPGIGKHIMKVFYRNGISSKEPLINELDTYGCFQLQKIGASSIPALEEYTGRKLVYNSYGYFYSADAMEKKKNEDRRKKILKYKTMKWLSISKIEPDDGDFVLIDSKESESGMMILKYNPKDKNKFKKWMPLPDLSMVEKGERQC